MSSVVIVWSAEAAIAATLGCIHVAAWISDRRALANLMFSLSAFAVAGIAGCELVLMHTESVARFGVIMRWGQALVFVMQVGIVMFVSLHFGTGRRWLAWASVITRLAAAIIGFIVEPNINYSSIVALKQVPLLGEKIWIVAEATVSPWNRLPALASLLAFAFVADASLALWRKGGVEARRRALFVGATISLYIAAAGGMGVLIHTGVIRTPYLISILFLAIVITMGAELSRDVIRATRLADELRESVALQKQMQDRFRLSVEASPNGMVLADANGRILLVNKRASMMFGYDNGELIGQHVERLVPERVRGQHAIDRPTFHAMPTARTMGEGREVFARRKNGSEFPVEIGLNPIESSEGILVLSAIVDISERRLVEAESRALREELTHVARVASLTELSGSLAHELNQPLATILCNAEAARQLVDRVPLDVAEMREILDDIVAEDRRAGEVIKRLRALLKRGEVQPSVLSLHDAVEDVLRLVHADLVARGVIVERELAKDLPPVLGDRVQLQQVVLNLVMNAADAMAETEQGSRRLHMRTACNNGSVRLSVRDHGCGLPADSEQMFAPFHTTKVHGLGMGLAICRTIVGAHNGRLWAEANRERGAVFHLELPTHSGDEK